MGAIRVFTFVLVGLLLLGGVAAAAGTRQYRAHLNGAQEIPPAGVVVETNGQGQARFTLSEDGQRLAYALNVANTAPITQAHIGIFAHGVGIERGGAPHYESLAVTGCGPYT